MAYYSTILDRTIKTNAGCKALFLLAKFSGAGHNPFRVRAFAFCFRPVPDKEK